MTTKGRAIFLSNEGVSTSNSRKRSNDEGATHNVSPKRQKSELSSGSSPSPPTSQASNSEPGVSYVPPITTIDQDVHSINIWDSTFELDTSPLVPDCMCIACKHHTRAYIHHLLKSKVISELYAYLLTIPFQIIMYLSTYF